MIFLVIIFFVVAVVVTLVYIDNTNIKKIENFLSQQNCKTIDYTRGTYQAICRDKVIVIKNGFKVDLNEAKTIYYKTLKEVQPQERKLQLINHENTTLEFKDDASKEQFLKKLEEKRVK